MNEFITQMLNDPIVSFLVDWGAGKLLDFAARQAVRACQHMTLRNMRGHHIRRG